MLDTGTYGLGALGRGTRRGLKALGAEVAHALV
jgi:hypothetical protein